MDIKKIIQDYFNKIDANLERQGQIFKENGVFNEEENSFIMSEETNPTATRILFKIEADNIAMRKKITSLYALKRRQEEGVARQKTK